jgi:hypothetical protein
MLIKLICYSYHPQDLMLPGDISFGAKEQFENEAKMAVRLANFISAFLQVSHENNSFVIIFIKIVRENN